MEPEEIQEKIAELWTRYLPIIAARVDALEQACAALRLGNFSEEERNEALSAAHKLAGALGTFGRAHGTELAREIESWLQTRNTAIEHARSIELSIRELREIVGRG